jgi:UDP-N-acetylmuramoylalanine--D-glutamate ligase
MTLAELEHKSILILGFGVEGQSTYIFLRNRFPDSQLGIADRKSLQNANLPDVVASTVERDANLRFHGGSEYLSCLSSYDVVVKSPGIPPSTPELVQFQAHGGIITSHLEIFLDVAGPQHVIGVTGTKGKSTTASLIHRLLTGAGIDSILGGNIGAPPLANIDAIRLGRCWWVLELSSYQLDQLRVSPHIAVLLGVMPEHLGVHDPSISYVHHRDFASYAGAKERITRYQNPDDILIFNADNDVASEIAHRSRARLLPVSQTTEPADGSFVRNAKLMYSKGGVADEIIDAAQIHLLGRFNQINVMAAVTVALLVGVPKESINRSVSAFSGLPHRLEFVREVSGVKFYDDSISTIPQATINALGALGDRVSTIILGGHDRGNDFSELAACLIKKQVRHLILFAPSGLRIWKALEQQGSLGFPLPSPHFVTSMQEAVDIALSCTVSGDICLLSPASSSYGMFKNFEARGIAFQKAIPSA